MSGMMVQAETRMVHWRGVVAEQRASGKSVMVFCRERGINHHTLRYWRKKIFPEIYRGKTKSKSMSRFISVAGSAGFSSHSPRVVLPNGVHIDLGAGLESDLVSHFIRGLCGVNAPVQDGYFPSTGGRRAKS